MQYKYIYYAYTYKYIYVFKYVFNIWCVQPQDSTYFLLQILYIQLGTCEKVHSQNIFKYI